MNDLERLVKEAEVTAGEVFNELQKIADFVGSQQKRIDALEVRNKELEDHFDECVADAVIEEMEAIERP